MHTLGVQALSRRVEDRPFADPHGRQSHAAAVHSAIKPRHSLARAIEARAEARRARGAMLGAEPRLDLCAEGVQHTALCHQPLPARLGCQQLLQRGVVLCEPGDRVRPHE